MDVAGCYQAFVDQVWAAMDEVDQMNLLGRMDQIRTQIAPYVSMDLRKPYTDARVETYQNNMRYFVTERRARLQQMLPPAE
jgi:hypothetical protein